MRDYMNEPLDHGGKAYVQDMWVMCPYCGRRLFQVNKDTKIENLVYKCKNTKCKHDVIVMV